MVEFAENFPLYWFYISLVVAGLITCYVFFIMGKDEIKNNVRETKFWKSFFIFFGLVFLLLYVVPFLVVRGFP